jgi:hypothetical protein
MNLLGKILVTLILVMSILFMAFAISVYATHRNWKDVVTNTYKPQLAEAQRRNSELTAQLESEKTRLAAERAARRSALAALETRAQQLEEELAQANNQLGQLSEQGRTALAALTGAQNTLTALKGEVDDLRSAVKTAQDDRDKMFQQVVDLSVKEQQAEGVRRRLEERNRELTDRHAKATAVLRAHGLTEETSIVNVAPQRDGEIKEVDADNKYVVVSLGSDDGITKQHTLDVYRQDKYLGRVQVTKTDPDRAVAKVLDGFRKGAIRVGDSVATQIR